MRRRPKEVVVGTLPRHLRRAMKTLTAQRVIITADVKMREAVLVNPLLPTVLQVRACGYLGQAPSALSDNIPSLIDRR